MAQPVCINCGLPLVPNHHPDAGKPESLNVVGATQGCLPCAEKRATGRQRVYAEFVRWLDEQISAEEKTGCIEALAAFRIARVKIDTLELNRKIAFLRSR